MFCIRKEAGLRSEAEEPDQPTEYNKASLLAAVAFRKYMDVLSPVRMMQGVRQGCCILHT